MLKVGMGLSGNQITFPYVLP